MVPMHWAHLLNQYVSETWERPSGCVARNVDGNPLVHGVDENVLPLAARMRPVSKRP